MARACTFPLAATAALALVLCGCGGTGGPGAIQSQLKSPAPTISLSAQPGTITSGGSTTLSWNSANATSVSIDNGVGSVAVNGSVQVTPSATTTYHAVANGAGGTAQSAATVTVNPPVSLQFSAMPANIFLGKSSTLQWSSSGASSVSIPGVGDFGPSGSTTVSPATTQTYSAVATGAGGTASATATVTVASTATPIQHLIVVLMQNNSFDHLFGVFPAPPGQTIDGIRAGIPGNPQTDANGNSVAPFLLTDPSPPNLNEGRSPYIADIDGGLMDKFAAVNGDQAMGYYDSTIPGISTLWGYAQQFALADHYFQSVIGEAPTNQLYLVAAADAGDPNDALPAFAPCNPASGGKSYSFRHLGDQFNDKKIAWTLFQENYTNALNGNCAGFVAAHDPFQFFVDTNNTNHIQDFSQFGSQLANGTFPALSFVIPNASHDWHPGNSSSSEAMNFLSNLVNKVQNSSIWPSTAILITFDTGGGWYDHVPPPSLDAQGLGFRVPLLVLSPFAKPGYVSHLTMDHVSILRFAQQNWGLPSLNGRNAASGNITDMFQFPQ